MDEHGNYFGYSNLKKPDLFTARRPLPWPSFFRVGSLVTWIAQYKGFNRDAGIQRTKTGKIVQITDQLVILDTGTYRECFSRTDLFTQEVSFAKPADEGVSGIGE